MSPNQGRRGTSGKGGGDGARGPAATRRLGLILFGVAFLALFIIVAIAEGVGDPSIPSGNVALIQDTPGDAGEVTKDEVDHAIELTSAQAGEKTTPKPGDPKYQEQKEAALRFLFEGIWIEGLAEEWGITVTDEKVAEEVEKVKKESFKTDAEFEKFRKESHYTQADIETRVRIQVLSQKLQEQLKEKAPQPTQSEIEAYYEAAKDTQFTTKSSRDIRVVTNKDRKKTEEALEALSGDNTAKNWAAVAKKYSADPTTKASGGLQKGLQEGTLEEPLDAAVFGAPEGQVDGPIKTPAGYTVFEVVNSTPESVQELKAVESQIKSTLAQRLEQEYFTGFVAKFNAEWSGRTFCADGYVIERCANYKFKGHPVTAPPACYEANPKGGLPDACPAPVAQLVPALPGTVTPLEPKGKPLAQRPQPVPGAAEGAEGAEGAGGLPPGVAPPTQAPSE